MTIDAEMPEVIKMGLLGMQVCVPKDWTDERIENFANTRNPTGIQSKWKIVRAGDAMLAGDKERVQCDGRADFVHMLLSC